jgi:hypothetical protein
MAHDIFLSHSRHDKLEPVPKTRFFRETHVARRGIAKICNLKRYLLALLCVLGLKPAI